MFVAVATAPAKKRKRKQVSTATATATSAAAAASALPSFELDREMFNRRIEVLTKRERLLVEKNQELADANKLLESVADQVRQLFLICPISTDDMVIPVTFPTCRHVFNYEGLVEWYAQRMSAKLAFTCPLCRQQSNEHPEDLPINLPLLELRKVIFPKESIDWKSVRWPRGEKSNTRDLAVKFPAAAAIVRGGGGSGAAAAATVASRIDRKVVKTSIDRQREVFHNSLAASMIWAESFVNLQLAARINHFVHNRPDITAELVCMEMWFNKPPDWNDIRARALIKVVESMTDTPGMIAKLVTSDTAAAAAPATTTIVLNRLYLSIPIKFFVLSMCVQSTTGLTPPSLADQIWMPKRWRRRHRRPR